ncbi:MAG: RNA polymerase factor sigma-54 [Muribaculum sp.]|nr:RNA polymerase factor sigma-54 [Muribaculaceae bacterium]MCM1080828.1 RNA polymerase factor sigma-54 [Muribaculum sp.]
MDESLNLSQQQRLQQKLSPLQVRFGKMLEMTGPELEDEVRRVLDDNPALTEVDNDETNSVDHLDAFNETAEQVQMADYANDDELPPQLYATASGHDYVEPFAADTSVTMLDAIVEQLAELPLSPQQQQIGIYVAGNIDDNGYLVRDVTAMADDIEVHTGRYVSPQQVQQVLDIVRSLDPPGIGAVDLRDCLLLQLRRRKPSATRDTAIEIITHYFDIFSLKHYPRLLSSLGITEPQLKDALALIRQLNPKPGSLLQIDTNYERTHHIVPDFAVEVDGDIVTVSLPNRIPELAIESTFSLEAEPKATTSSAQSAAMFVKQKRDEALDFMRLLKMRQNTLLRIMEAVVELQRDFFVKGACANTALIHPMILKDVAALTGYDLSVISRATAGKYVATPAGVYPLKMFFNERTNDVDDTSAHEIMNVILEIINSEDKKHPLSDDAITQQLQKRGYDIARRTVAKYRERMAIPVGRLRREL